MYLRSFLCQYHKYLNRGFANYQHATGLEGHTGLKIYWPSEFSIGPIILSRSKLFWIQRSAHCKTNITQTNYDEFCLKQFAITSHNFFCTKYSHCSNYKSTAFQHYILLVKLFTSHLHFQFENKQHHLEQTLFFCKIQLARRTSCTTF